MHILVVGSSVVDLFLSVDPKHVETQDKKVLLSLGDKIPSEIKKFALGGNGANVSVGLTRLEIPTTFYTYLGNDILSREIEEGLTREGVKLAAERDKFKSAPLHIILDFDTDRIILSHYEKAEHGFSYDGRDKFDFIYLNSIAEYWQDAYQKVYEYAAKTSTPFALSLGSRQLDNLNDLIYKIIGHTKIFFSNKEEAQRVLKNEEQDIKKLLLGIKELGPEIVSITDGANGAYALDPENNYSFIKPVEEDAKEKTGAGDAYSTGFFASHLHGNDIATSMKWGVFNAAAVMRQVGAQSGLMNKKSLDSEIKENNNLEAEKI